MTHHTTSIEAWTRSVRVNANDRPCTALLIALLLIGCAVAAQSDSRPSAPESKSAAAESKPAAASRPLDLDPPDFPGGLPEIQRLAAEGNPAAMTALAMRHDMGFGVKHDEAEALRLLLKAYEGGDPGSTLYLAMKYYDRPREKANFPEALKWSKRAADHGFVVGMFMQGQLHLAGLGTPVDIKTGMAWLVKAAELDHLQSIITLWEIYQSNDLVPADPVAAFKWACKAAELEHVAAMLSVADAYLEGIGVATDKVAAFGWFKKAAELRSTEATYRLGTCYAEGVGTKKNDEEAVKCFKKAAVRGHAYSLIELGHRHSVGKGVEKDEAESTKQYKRAAERGSGYAMLIYARTLFEGRGVEKNLIEAWAWASLATDDVYSKDQVEPALAEIGEQMSPSQIVDAKKRATEIEKSYLQRNRRPPTR